MPSKLKWWRAFVKAVRGTYKVTHDTRVKQSEALLQTSTRHFEFIVFYELDYYTWRYSKWYVPDSVSGVATIFVQLVGQPPEDLASACADPIFLPVEKVSGSGLSKKQRHRLRLMVLDILHARIHEIRTA